MKTKLRELRQSKNLSQENIAYELSISQKAYSKIENGKVCLSIDKALKLSKIYNVSPSHFCEIASECSSCQQLLIEKMKHYLNQKNIDLPKFLL